MRKAGIAFVLLMVVAGEARAQSQTTPESAFFDNSTIRDIHLVVSARDWNTLKDRVEEDTYYQASFTWNGITVRNVGIRSRGNTTRNPVKPGLRVDINHYIADQEFLGLKAFALDNTYSDPSLMHELITMKVFAALGLVAPREAHVRLFVNNTYAGVYTVIESIDRPFIARNFGSSEADLERGGYLYEYHWVGPYGFEYLGSALQAYAELFTPKTRETDSAVALYEPIHDLVRAMNESDPGNMSELSAALDLPRFVRYLAIENFMAEIDGLVGEWELHNFYLYRFRDGRPAQLIPWDKDSTFASVEHPVNYHLDQNVLTRLVFNVPALAQIYSDTLMACAALASRIEGEDTRGWLEREVDWENALITDAVAADRGTAFSFEEYEAEVERLRDFARRRPALVQQALSGNAQ